MFIQCEKPEEVVKEAFWLAWKACGKPKGYGMLQDRPNATKEEVWHNVITRGDYPGAAKERIGEAFGDYVFGRMMKLGLKWTDVGVNIPDVTPDGEYQSWCGKYPTYANLVKEAINSSKI